MRVLRSLLTVPFICLLAGALGGLGLGYLLSRDGAWLTLVPWALYLTGLLAVIAAASWADERRRRRAALRAWPLPPGFTVADAGQWSGQDADGAAPPDNGGDVVPSEQTIYGD